MHIPYLKSSDAAFDSLPEHPVACCNWPEAFPAKPKASFRIFHDGENLHIRYRVDEPGTAAATTADNGPVWLDSCVEFFIAPDDAGYYNFELNCIGALLIGYRDTGGKVTHAPVDGHDCLAQLRVPDGRRRGGTMRFWEAQYDVFMLPNMLSSPHGWSAWRAYATYYAYLLTGDERWLRETFDAASAFAALLDHSTGDLSWAFVVDPYVRAIQTCEPDTAYTADDDTYGNPHPQCYPNREIIVGEQYVPMISDWQTIVSSDNDVFECFKFIAEAVLCNAFVVERPDGTIAAYNCRAERRGDTLHVTADEPQITTLYTNLHSPLKVEFDGDVKKVHKL